MPISELEKEQAEPTDVSRATRTAKDSNGERLFDYDDCLRSQQVSSYCLAAKRSAEVGHPDSGEETPGKDIHSVVRDKVLSDVSIQHSSF